MWTQCGRAHRVRCWFQPAWTLKHLSLRLRKQYVQHPCCHLADPALRSATQRQTETRQLSTHGVRAQLNGASPCHAPDEMVPAGAPWSAVLCSRESETGGSGCWHPAAAELSSTARLAYMVAGGRGVVPCLPTGCCCCRCIPCDCCCCCQHSKSPGCACAMRSTEAALSAMR